ncbi:TetR/AcrR family transcriptional regulator [Streptomyces sp. NBC_01477]|uniref:TetR/AcrR family transcriptional regulator n=1 Tax=Streptomyces sp. NBC_01477 TaxID=2976015 RepID=UPI002E332B7F|nr:TetR/AcrR family transcriptional regulator [Streptomyces sp. NBC_01477]
MSEADERPRRRQARGERRITQLLQAAASVFCTLGYTASSTNAIAREAGVSPGTLYQFFPNKEAIAVELGGKLIKEMEEAHGRVFTAENARLPLDRLIDAVADPFIEFNCANPAFLALIKGPDTPGKVSEEHDTLHATLLDGVSWILALRRPSLSTLERTLIAEMSFAMFKAALDLVVQNEGEERAAYAHEMKSMLYRYLAPCIGTGPVVIGEAETAAAHAAVSAGASTSPGDTGKTVAGATSRVLPTSS